MKKTTTASRHVPSLAHTRGRMSRLSFSFHGSLDERKARKSEAQMTGARMMRLAGVGEEGGSKERTENRC